ncbi:sugar nucleotidyltransferase [Nocardiopsis sp. Huas11]|uniref:sugar nucleotidyltransferase n=1 Tax=Nocardiopsis sp. Huas11 TaxID=2183912 RepID=UPI000EAD2368|nr:sugar phosphate nucleotidyltransferase [Nocardiopsis sp. Huas11]
MKGIVLAGGTGSRLFPSTRGVSKHLFPVYDKPMFYYPVSVLMQAGVREILIISTPETLPLIRRVLGDGNQLGVEFSYAAQAEPRGIAEAFLIGRSHIEGGRSALVLGDNIFHGESMFSLLDRAASASAGCVLFGCEVAEPQRYAVAGFGDDGRLDSLVEKPAEPVSDYAVAGLYFYDERVVEIAEQVVPSGRGELEVTDVNRAYMKLDDVQVVTMGKEIKWLDLGTEDSLMEGAGYVSSVLRDSGSRVACLEEIALRMGFIGPEQCHRLGEAMGASPYGEYVMSVAQGRGTGEKPALDALVWQGAAV